MGELWVSVMGTFQNTITTIPDPITDLLFWLPPSCDCAVVVAVCLTHWGRVTHICVAKLTIIGSDNGLSPGRRQAIIWTNAGILLIRPLGTNFSEILIRIQTFSFKKMHLKMSSPKWRPFCLGLNVLISCDRSVGDYHMELCFIVRILHTSMRGIYQYLFNRGCLTQSGYFGHRMPMKTNCHRGYTTIIHFQLPVTHGASICYIMTTWHGNVFALCPFCEGNHRWLADSPHKGQVMQSVDDAEEFSSKN